MINWEWCFGKVEALGRAIYKNLEGRRLQIKLSIIKQHGSYIVKRVGGDYSFHAHISTYKGCKILRDCIKKNKLPRSDYLKGSCKRLLTREEYSRLRKPKDRYVNISKGTKS